MCTLQYSDAVEYCTLWNIHDFQVEDLRVASPATVSRCGMVYIDPEELKWLPYVKTWMAGIEEKVSFTNIFDQNWLIVKMKQRKVNVSAQILRCPPVRRKPHRRVSFNLR